MSLYERIPHPHIAERDEQGPVKVSDQMPNGNAVNRFNSRVATVVTNAVGTMWCAYAFAVFDMLALPQAIHGGLYGIVQWVASFFLQLVLLSIIMVGQSNQAAASDKRADQTYKDAEAILHECIEMHRHLEAQDEILARIDGGQPAPPSLPSGEEEP